jgi:uroporphyrinogen III methyltransferase/synthase
MNTVKRKIHPGKVYLVGAGPGHPELITLRGIRCLEKAQVVVYDHLAGVNFLSYVPKAAERIYVGKEASRHTLTQDGINKLLVQKARQGLTVVRLKGGDPFVFGRGGEECEVLHRAGIPFEVVPGVTAGISAPAFAGIPVTHRNVASSMALITGHEDPTKGRSSLAWKYLSKGVDTLVFYMGVSNLPHIVKQLIKSGRPASTPIALVQWGTTARQKTLTGTLGTIVGEVERQNMKPPAIIIVGKVVSLRSSFNWFEKLPLFGKKIINTRSRSQASEFSSQLRDLGAEVLELPTIETVPVGKTSVLAKTIKNLGKYQWLIFTSPNGVDAFFNLLFQIHGDVRVLAGIKLASIGPGTTKAIEKYSIKPAVTAREAVAEGLVRDLQKVGSWEGVRVLLARAEKARDVLPQTLKQWGAKVDVVTAYRTVLPFGADPAVLKDILDGNYDLMSFSSSSTFDNFIALAGKAKLSKVRQTLKAASIGPVTSASIRACGIEPRLEAKEHTIPGLVKTICEYFHEK